jgi:hypothetical protein
MFEKRYLVSSPSFLQARHVLFFSSPDLLISCQTPLVPLQNIVLTIFQGAKHPVPDAIKSVRIHCILFMLILNLPRNYLLPMIEGSSIQERKIRNTRVHQ